MKFVKKIKSHKRRHFMTQIKQNQNNVFWKKIKSSLLPAIGIAAFILLFGMTGKTEFDSLKEEEDNPQNSTYFNYENEAWQSRPYRMDDIDVNATSFKKEAESFNKCKHSCYEKNLYPQDYFHNYTGNCKCLTLKEKIAFERKVNGR